MQGDGRRILSAGLWRALYPHLASVPNSKDVRPQGRLASVKRSRVFAFTLTELLVSIGIVAILAALAIQGYSKVTASVAKARCISNLRNLHVSFATYIQDNGYWPQQPDFSSAHSQEYQDWWLTTMDPYTKSREVWKCPLLKKFGAYGSGGKKLEIHYKPTRFDARPTTPYRWAKQPWLIEVSSIHGNGPLLLMPDGSVRSLTDLVPNFYTTKN
jgi:prepilin-type N-terminal cleavage/methylation domain-containing protein